MPPREPATGRKCDRELECESDREWPLPDRGIVYEFGAHAGRRDAIALRSDPRCNDEQLARELNNKQLSPTTPAVFASAPPARAPLRAKAAAGVTREPRPLEQMKQMNQRLVHARGASELLSLHAEHGRSFNYVNLFTCAPPPRAPPHKLSLPPLYL